jgi:hypothetical protein
MPFDKAFSYTHIKRSIQMKKTILLALTIALALALIACKDEPPAEEPKPQSNEITIVTELGSFTATVKGEFTDTQWNGVPTTIETAFNNAANDPLTEDAIINAFGGTGGVVIMVEKTTEYQIYKTVAGNKKTLFVNIDGLGNLQAKVKEASTALSNGTESKE